MRKCRGSETRAGFSLIEVALAVAIASLAVLSLIGILPQSLEFERNSTDLTAIGTIMEDIHDRLEGQELKEGIPSISPIFYDMRGRYWDTSEDRDAPDTSTLVDRKFFRAEIKLVKPMNASTASTPPLVIRIDFFWPIDDEGNPIGDGQPKSGVTYYTTALTGPDWEEIDPLYQKKIEY